jgi:hypothetical protein
VPLPEQPRHLKALLQSRELGYGAQIHKKIVALLSVFDQEDRAVKRIVLHFILFCIFHMPECSFPALQQLVGNAPVSPSGSVMAAFIPQNEK